MPSPELTQELAQLFNQQLSEFWEIIDLRMKLAAAESRHLAFAEKIRGRLKAQEDSCITST